MTDAPAKTRLTLAEFHEKYAPEERDLRLELIDGVVVDKSAPRQQNPLATMSFSMPQLAVEVQQPGQKRSELRERAEHYLANGAKQAWIIYPTIRKVEVMTKDDVEVYEMGDTIDTDDLLPGFKLEIAKVFNYARAE